MQVMPGIAATQTYNSFTAFGHLSLGVNKEIFVRVEKCVS